MEGLARSSSPPSPPYLRLVPAAVRGLGWSPPEKYEPRRVIGSGGMGTVLLARDRNLDRLVAIKVLLTDCHVLLARLRREARLLARLEHPSIVRVHDLDVHAGRLYLAMEYAPGGSLATSRAGLVEFVRTVRGVIDALAHAHARGIVHRDVKPENVLLLGPGRADGRGPAVLADFGLALGPDEGSLALRRPIVGTPVTMSPEQIAGDPVGPASDVFSTGVTLYRASTGRWPFPGRTALDVLEAIRERDPEPMRTSGSPVPRRLESIVLRALAKDPADRFPSMAELGRALDGFLLARTLFALPFGGLLRRGSPRLPAGPTIHPEILS